MYRSEKIILFSHAHCVSLGYDLVVGHARIRINCKQLGSDVVEQTTDTVAHAESVNLVS